MGGDREPITLMAGCSPVRLALQMDKAESMSYEVFEQWFARMRPMLDVFLQQASAIANGLVYIHIAAIPGPPQKAAALKRALVADLLDHLHEVTGATRASLLLVDVDAEEKHS